MNVDSCVLTAEESCASFSTWISNKYERSHASFSTQISNKYERSHALFNTWILNEYERSHALFNINTKWISCYSFWLAVLFFKQQISWDIQKFCLIYNE